MTRDELIAEQIKRIDEMMALSELLGATPRVEMFVPRAQEILKLATEITLLQELIAE